jgi:hypothetical protein
MAEERIDQKSSGSAPEKEAELRRLLFERLSGLRAQTGELPASVSNASNARPAAPEGSRRHSKLVAPGIEFEDIADDAGEDEDYVDEDDEDDA